MAWSGVAQQIACWAARRAGAAWHRSAGSAGELRGHDALHAADLGGHFTVLRSMDAREYYLADFDPAEYYGEEYMN